MSGAIVGRDVEARVLRAFVGAVSGRSAALVLEGEAGMGKTTLWEAGVAMRRSRAPRAPGDGRPRARPRSASPGSATSSTRCSTRRWRRCREAARVLARARARRRRGPASDPHAVGVALLNALRALAAERPRARRGRRRPVARRGVRGALGYAAATGTSRSASCSRAGSALESALAVERRRCARSSVRELEVGPLDAVGAAPGRPRPPRRRPSAPAARRGARGGGRQPLLRARDRPHAAAIRASPSRRGSRCRCPTPPRPRARPPARAPAREPRLPARRRRARAPDDRDHGAASGVARVGLPAGARGGHRRARRDADPLHPSAARGRCVRDGRPACAEADVHARLAELLEDPEARAWQLAASVERADESVAAALEEAAQHARSRGRRARPLLLDRARELTPPIGRTRRSSRRGRGLPALRVGGLVRVPRRGSVR